MTSTVYASIAPCKVINACFVHSRGRLSWNSSTKIPELMTSWCSILRTMRMDALVDHGGFPLRTEMNWSQSSLHTPSVYYMVCWPSFGLIWAYSHPIACCFSFLLLPVLRTISECASWDIFLEAALSALRWTNWCLPSRCVPESAVLGVMPIDPPGSVPFSPCWGVCVAMICWCRIGEEDDNEKKWEVLRNIYVTTSQNEICNCQVAPFTQVESCCVGLQIAGVSDRSAIRNKSVLSYHSVHRDKSRWTTDESSRLTDIHRICFAGNDVWWCLTQEIPRIVDQTDAENGVILHC